MPSNPSPDSPRPATDEPKPVPDDSEAWLALVAEKVRTMRFGVLQITVHESRIVQIERTERTRFESPRTARGR
jgi:hypothetical protein